MPLTLYHNPACSTSRQVLTALRAAGHAPRVVEYLKQALDAAQLTALSAKVGGGALAITRRKEALFASLALGADAVSDAQRIAAIAQHPLLLNRPIVETDDWAMVVRPSALVEQVLQRLGP